MNRVFFRFKEHPGDFFRNTEPTVLIGEAYMNFYHLVQSDKILILTSNGN